MTLYPLEFALVFDHCANPPELLICNYYVFHHHLSKLSSHGSGEFIPCPHSFSSLPPDKPIICLFSQVQACQIHLLINRYFINLKILATFSEPPVQIWSYKHRQIHLPLKLLLFPLLMGLVPFCTSDHLQMFESIIHNEGSIL